MWKSAALDHGGRHVETSPLGINEPFAQIMRFIEGHDFLYSSGGKHPAYVFHRKHIESFSVVGHS